MSANYNSPSVGNTLVFENGKTIRVWTVTKIWKGGARATVRTAAVIGKSPAASQAAETRQITRGRFGGWSLGNSSVAFSTESDPRTPADWPNVWDTAVVDDEMFTVWLVSAITLRGASLHRVVRGVSYSSVAERSPQGVWTVGGRPVRFSR